MSLFPSLPAEPQLANVFRRFPHTAPPLLEYHDRLMRDHSPLTVAERELIAAYVSGLNACTYCYGSHVIAAGAFGVDESVFAGLLRDIETSGVDQRLKPILRYVAKLTHAPSRMTLEDAAAVYEAGWDEQALFDAVSVCALYSLMNRIVEGTGVRMDPLSMSAEDIEARRARMAHPSDDAHEAPRSYSALLERWGIDAEVPARPIPNDAPGSDR